MSRSRLRAAALVVAFAVALAAGLQTTIAAQGETINEILVHGNHTTPEVDILSLAGLSLGAPAHEEALGEAEGALRRSGRFDAVDVRRRFRSLDDPTDILVIIVVDERAGVSEDNLVPGIGSRMLSSLQLLPVLNYADGYGTIYGARIAFADGLGPDSRIAVPLWWGGERRAALELERDFAGRAPLVRGIVSATRHENPAFGVADSRISAFVEVEQPIRPWLRAGLGAGVQRVHFGPDYTARHTSLGAHVTLDTRVDPSFPRNAVLVQLGRERLDVETGHAGRWFTDARGFVGIGGATLLAVRGHLVTSDAALPAAEQALLGGASALWGRQVGGASSPLRGYPVGYRAGDNLAAVSAEVRHALTSPLRVGHLGVKGFVDAGTTWEVGARLADQRFDRGVGAGVYFGFPVITMDLDVAWPEEGGPRVHFGMGARF